MKLIAYVLLMARLCLQYAFMVWCFGKWTSLFTTSADFGTYILVFCVLIILEAPLLEDSSLKISVIYDVLQRPPRGLAPTLIPLDPLPRFFDFYPISYFRLDCVQCGRTCAHLSFLIYPTFYCFSCFSL
jgi:hypothetical protein